MVFAHRTFSKALASLTLGTAILSACAGVAVAKARRPAGLDDDQVHADIHGAIDVNRRSPTENDYRLTGETAEDVFSNFSALRDEQLWSEACTVLRNLPSESLALYDGVIHDSQYASIPCRQILNDKLQLYWQDSQRLLQIHVDQKRLQSKLSYASADNGTDRTLASKDKAPITEERSLSDIKKGEVALVFQNGPYPGRTDRILEALKKYGVQANFLVRGTSCRAHPELIRKIAAQHEILGSFGMTKKALDRLPINEAELQMDQGHEALTTASGIPSTLFGFPLAASSPDLIEYAQQKKWTILVSKLGFVLGGGVMTFDSRDWQLMDPSALYDHVVSNLEHGTRSPASTMPVHASEAGQVILFHDEYEATVIALPAILEEILSRGLKPVVVVK